MIEPNEYVHDNVYIVQGYDKYDVNEASYYKKGNASLTRLYTTYEINIYNRWLQGF